MNYKKLLKVIKTQNKGNGLFAVRNIKKGETILEFIGVIKRPEETDLEHSLQIDDETFLESRNIDRIDDNLNHSCQPNCMISFEKGAVLLKSIKEIKDGNELTFDYDTTEYDLVEQNLVFKCVCGAENCRKEIRGFKYLDFQTKNKILKYCSPFIKQKFMNE